MDERKYITLLCALHNFVNEMHFKDRSAKGTSYLKIYGSDTFVLLLVSYADAGRIFHTIEPATCSLTVTRARPGGTSILKCQGEGIPVPTFGSWQKNSGPLPGRGSFSVKAGPQPGSQLLLISRFGVEHLGLYQCSVSNKLGKSSCTLNFTGTALKVFVECCCVCFLCRYGNLLGLQRKTFSRHSFPLQ